MGSFRGDAKLSSSWPVRIAVNESLGPAATLAPQRRGDPHVRRRHRCPHAGEHARRELTPLRQSPGPARRGAQADRVAHIDKAARRLRTVFVLRAIEEMKASRKPQRRSTFGSHGAHALLPRRGLLRESLSREMDEIRRRRGLQTPWANAATASRPRYWQGSARPKARRGRGSAPAPPGWRSASVFFTGLPVHTRARRAPTILLLFVRGMSATWRITRGHVAWRGVGADQSSLIRASTRAASSVASSRSRTKSDHAHVASCQSWPITIDSIDFVQLLDLPVDLGRADAHAAGVEHRVRAAVDDHAAVRGDLAPVAVAPDAREALEVGGAVLRAVRIVPEAERHRRETASVQTSSPFCPTGSGVPVVVEHLDLHARAARHCSSPRQTGRVGQPPREAARRCRCRREIDDRQTSLLDVLVDVVEALRARAASRSTGSRRSDDELVRLRSDRRRPWPTASMNFGRGAEVRHAARRRRKSKRMLPLAARTASRRRAAASAPDASPDDEPVPHHPAAGREVEQRGRRASRRSAAECSLRCMQQRAARAVHDALRHAGRAASSRGCRAGWLNGRRWIG